MTLRRNSGLRLTQHDNRWEGDDRTRQGGEHEVETALAREQEQKRTMLFPIRLDDAVMEIKRETYGRSTGAVGRPAPNNGRIEEDVRE